MTNINIFELTLPKFQFTHRPIKLFEAFSGIGCQAMALKKLGVEYETVGISEIDKFAIMSYNFIHGKTKNYGDISKMDNIPECDIFTWSFPCTDLSKAGKREGLQGGTRSGLVYEVLRLLQVSKPKVLIMENVPDLIQASFVEEFGEIRKELEDLGYSNYVERLNAKDYGVVQNRDRVFMVSILGDWYYEFPQKIKLEKRLKDYLEDEVDEKYYLNEKQLKAILNTVYESMAIDRVKSVNDLTINAITTMQGGNREPKIAYALSSREFSSRGWLNQSPTLTARDYKDPKVILEKKFNSVIDLKSSNNFRRKSNTELVPAILTDSRFSCLETMCLNPKVDGKQPSIQDRIYDSKGLATAITTSFMPSIAIPENTKQGYSLAKDGDGVYLNRPHQKRGVVQKGMIQTLKTSGDDLGVVIGSMQKNAYKGTINQPSPTLTNAMGQGGGHTPMISNKIKDNQISDYTIKYENDNLKVVVDIFSKAYILDKKTGTLFRVRKLTPKECWSLMGISDEDFDKASKVVSNSQLYKQAGNGIVVDVFAAILKNLFVPGKEYQNIFADHETNVEATL